MTEELPLSLRLRAATENDVEAALAACEADGDLQLVPASQLLEFFNRMLDLLRRERVRSPSL